MTHARWRALFIAYMLAIYATLGVVRDLTDWLRARGVLRAAVAVSFTAAAALVVGALHRQRRLGRRSLAVLAGAAALEAAVIWPLASVEEKVHFVEYGVAAWLAFLALAPRLSVGRRALAATLLTAFLGLVDELIQGVLPTRHYDPRDVAFNAVAAALAMGALVALDAVRNDP